MEKQAILGTPIGEFDPDLSSQLSQAVRADISQIPMGSVQALNPVFQAAAGFSNLRVQLANNTPVDDNTAQFWSALTGKKKDLFVGRTPNEIQTALTLSSRLQGGDSRIQQMLMGAELQRQNLVFREQLRNQREVLTEGERELAETALGQALPEDVRRSTIKQLITNTKLSATDTKLRENAPNGS